MKITRISEFTGKEHTMELPVTEQQLKDYASGRDSIQRCFPKLTPSQREFIKTGVTQEEWDDAFPPEEED